MAYDPFLQKDMSPSVSGSLEKAARNLWRKVKENPDYLITSGELKLISSFEVDEKNEFHRKTGVKGLITPLRLTWPQQKLHEFPKFCHENDLPVSAIINKGRRVGLSSYVQARLFSSAIANSGVKNAVVAHLEESAENLLKMSRTYYAQLSPVNRFIFGNPNSKSVLGFRSDDPDFAVSDSQIMCSTASPDGLERFLGHGTLRVHLSEAAFYNDPEKIEQVLAATIMRLPGAEVWRESASNGENNHFGSTFLWHWKNQNSCNYWDKSFQFNKTPGMIALFFPFFADPQNRAALRKGVSDVDFIDNFDDYEKDLFFNVVIPHWVKEGFSPTEAYRIAVQNLAFRRSFLPTFYDNSLIAAAAPLSYTDKRTFKSEYPATPEEAFEGTGMRTVLPPEVITWCKETANAATPVFEGYISEGGVKGFNLTESEGGDVRIWKWPWETSGNTSFSLDPNDGIEGEGGSGGDNMRRDFTAGSGWDNESGEQICELHSQETDTDVSRKVYALMMFMSCTKTPEDRFVANERRLPFFTQECAGPRIVNYCVRDRGYPLEKVFIDTSMRTTDIAPTKRMGWTNTSSSKPEAVKAFKEYMVNAYNSRHQQGNAGIKRRIVKSKRLAEELSWFVVKPSPNSGHSKYEALEKGNWKGTSKDDLVMSLVIDCFAQEHRLAVGDLQIGSAFDDTHGGLLVGGKQVMDKITGFMSYTAPGAYPPKKPKFQMDSSEALVWERVWGSQAKSLDTYEWGDDDVPTMETEL